MEDFLPDIYAYQQNFIHSNPINSKNDRLDVALIGNENNKCKIDLMIKILIFFTFIGFIGIVGFLFFTK